MKRLIVNADDFGYTPGINRAILEASRATGGGIITAASLMANAAAFDDAVELARAAPGLDIGCHLNLVEGLPVSPPNTVPSLVDGAGNFLGANRLALRLISGRAILADMERECWAQVERVLAAGIQPSHLDTHQHTHLHPRVATAVARTARRFGINWLRRPFESLAMPARLGNFKRRGLARGLKFLARRFDQEISSHGRSCPDHFTGFILTGRLTADSLRETLDCLPDGTTELMCHPGYADAALAGTITTLQHQRQGELDALRDPRMRDVLLRQGIQLSSFRELPATAAARSISEALSGVESPAAERAPAGKAGAGRI